MNKRPSGMFDFCRTQDERDLAWYYQDSAAEVGLTAIRYTDTPGGEWGGVTPRQVKAAARQRHIRDALRLMAPEDIGVLECSYVPRALARQYLLEWGAAAACVAAVDRAWSQPDMPRSLAAYWRQPPGRLDLVDVESHQSREFSRAMRSAPRLLAELDRHWRGETGKATGTRGAWCAAALVERAHTAYGAAQYRLRREVEAAVAASPTATRVRGEVVAQAGARTKRGIIARVFGLWRDMVEDT